MSIRFYLQDYWQITPKLNLTYGVRYEYQQPYVEANNNEANFDIDTLLINLAGRGDQLAIAGELEHEGLHAARWE